MKYSWGYTTQLSSAECLQNIKKKKRKKKDCPPFSEAQKRSGIKEEIPRKRKNSDEAG